MASFHFYMTRNILNCSSYSKSVTSNLKQPITIHQLTCSHNSSILMCLCAAAPGFWGGKTELRGGNIPGSKTFTLERAMAISKVPTVSILAAMMGMPVHVCLEFLKVMLLTKSTWNAVFVAPTHLWQSKICSRKNISVPESDIMISLDNYKGSKQISSI